MTPEGHGLVLYAPVVGRDEEPILLRCLHCPRWHKQSTRAERAADFAAHLERHARRSRRTRKEGLRLSFDFGPRRSRASEARV